MPTSRNRRKPRTRRPRTGRRIATVRPGQDLTALLTPDDVAHMASAIDAAARGDVRGAIEHELAGLVVEESLTVPRLRDLLSADPAPAWAYSRWCVDQAVRWMLCHEDPRTDEAVRMTLAATHCDRLDALLDDPTALREYGTLVAATDWVCHQLAAYELGGLCDFLDVRAEVGLIDQADRVRDWPEARMGVYTVVRMAGPTLVLRDLASEEEVRVLNVGALSGRTRDECLLGRIVPITVAPGLMFESRPVAVDGQTAQDAATRIRARQRLGWLLALAAARDDGRLPVGFSCTEKTPFTSDLPVVPRDEWEQKPAPRIQELIDRGHSHEVANAVGVLEVGLIAAKVSPDSVAAVVPHVVAALAVPGVFEAAMEECASTDDEPAWIVLADEMPDDVSSRCRELAARAAGTGRPVH